ncbi:YdeI/OmpD-associated family protein [Erythrobacter sp. NE805]|uniref:YdeI/OmpD-associated family protein n=1 Tax=Erythrobacter sp. NE805 TaxID=3389875 RepID=UPI00396AF20B
MYFPHSFTAEVVHHDVGSERYRYTVIFVPHEVKADLPLDQYPKLRITGEVDDHPIEAALTPVRGEHYILLSKKLLAAIGKRLGDAVELRFRIADQDAVEVPERLAEALARDPGMRALWEAATPGKQRALAYMVASAKRAETRDERIAKVAAVLRGEIDLNGRPLT